MQFTNNSIFPVKPRPPNTEISSPSNPPPSCSRTLKHLFISPGRGPPAPNATSAFPHVPRAPTARRKDAAPMRVAATEPNPPLPSPPPASPGRRRRPLKRAGTTGAGPSPALGGRRAAGARPARRWAGLRQGGAGLWLGGAPAGVRGSSPFLRRRRRPQHFRVDAEAGRRRRGGCYCSTGLGRELSPSALRVSVCPASSRPLTPGG